MARLMALGTPAATSRIEGGSSSFFPSPHAAVARQPAGAIDDALFRTAHAPGPSFHPRSREPGHLMIESSARRRSMRWLPAAYEARAGPGTLDRGRPAPLAPRRRRACAARRDPRRPQAYAIGRLQRLTAAASSSVTRRVVSSQRALAVDRRAAAVKLPHLGFKAPRGTGGRAVQQVLRQRLGRAAGAIGDVPHGWCQRLESGGTEILSSGEPPALGDGLAMWRDQVGEEAKALDHDARPRRVARRCAEDEVERLAVEPVEARQHLLRAAQRSQRSSIDMRRKRVDRAGGVGDAASSACAAIDVSVPSRAPCRTRRQTRRAMVDLPSRCRPPSLSRRGRAASHRWPSAEVSRVLASRRRRGRPGGRS